jgi:hypothetical protein
MTFKPTPCQIETLADHYAANMPLGATAAALDVHPDDLRDWDRQACRDPLTAPLCAAALAASAPDNDAVRSDIRVAWRRTG